jgi:hypothetical protein
MTPSLDRHVAQSFRELDPLRAHSSTAKVCGCALGDPAHDIDLLHNQNCVGSGHASLLRRRDGAKSSRLDPSSVRPLTPSRIGHSRLDAPVVMRRTASTNNQRNTGVPQSPRVLWCIASAQPGTAVEGENHDNGRYT